MIDIQLNSNDHLFIFIFLIALSFVAVGLHTEALLDSLLAVVVFPDRPGDILVKEGEMLQQTGQSVTELASEDQVESLLVELAGLVVLRYDELGLVGRGPGHGDGGGGERVVGRPLPTAGRTVA